MTVALLPANPPRHPCPSSGHRNRTSYSRAFGNRASDGRAVRSRTYSISHSPRHDSPDAATTDPALWQGAWVGWLTCQAVLLVLVESTELATDPRIALVTRALLLTAFVTAFRRPCFMTGLQRNLFTLCVLVAEVAIAACSDRLVNTTGWPLWTAIGVALLLLTTSLDASSDRATASNR